MNARAIPVVWTNDDIHFGQVGALRRQLKFLDRFGIPGVFFVIPRFGGGDLDDDKELMAEIERARAVGHEFYQHGFVHTPFECGVPEVGMFAPYEAVRRFYDEERDVVERMHTLEAQLEMVENGARIWRRAFGENSPGFRPGWGAFCGNFYRALAQLGFTWVSSRIPCFTSWQRAVGDWTSPMDFREKMSTEPHVLAQGIREFPMAGDHAFRVPNEPKRIASMVELGLNEFEVFSQRGHPMLLVSHFHGLEFPGEIDGAAADREGTGYAVHERLIPALLGTGRARFAGMKELTADCGKLPARAVE